MMKVTSSKYAFFSIKTHVTKNENDQKYYFKDVHILSIKNKIKNYKEFKKSNLDNEVI